MASLLQRCFQRNHPPLPLRLFRRSPRLFHPLCSDAIPAFPHLHPEMPQPGEPQRLFAPIGLIPARQALHVGAAGLFCAHLRIGLHGIGMPRSLIRGLQKPFLPGAPVGHLLPLCLRPPDLFLQPGPGLETASPVAQPLGERRMARIVDAPGFQRRQCLAARLPLAEPQHREVPAHRGRTAQRQGMRRGGFGQPVGAFPQPQRAGGLRLLRRLPRRVDR